ncbi:MAG: glycosyl hydrolase, partial [Gammaproteobacteria bacterium]|nr:glycosyl hydrolase [Gammaproteobacteria bacterium]
MRRCYILIATLLAATSADADFGQYKGHELDGQTLVIVSDIGHLRITPVDDAAFEVHYIEEGVKQLPSFAIADRVRPDVINAISETDSTVAYMIDGLTALIDKSPIRVSFTRDSKLLVAEEHGYFAYDTVRGFRFALEDSEKILGGGQRVMG